MPTVFADGDEYNYYYDNRGNVTADQCRGITNITYDHRNLPLTVSNIPGYPSRYRYDDAGQRVYKNVVDDEEYYLRDDKGRELAVYDMNSDRLKMVNLYGNDLIGRIDVDWVREYDYDIEEWVWNRVDSRKYYVKDHLGSIRQTLDESGTVQSAMDYYAFGGTLSSYVNGATVDKYKFTGKERDTETGLDYFGARYYDSKIGRWMSVDPFVEKFPGLSPYNYCKNNPLIYIDPDGNQSWPLNPQYKGFQRRSENNWHARRGGGRLHNGVDMNYGRVQSGDRGGPILATHDGRVTKVAGPGDKNGGGARIEITSKNGTVVTRYMHLNSQPNYQVGDQVKEGDKIGEMGGSGNGISDKYVAHLHYELSINGERVDPMGGNPNEPIDPQGILNANEKEEPIYNGGETPTVVVTPKEENKQ